MDERMIQQRQLNEQVRSVLTGMANTKNKIADLEEKIERLEEASSNLSTRITEVESLKSTVTGLEIDETKWKGKEHEDFEDVYDTYKEKARTYVSQTEEAKEDIDEDIKRYQDKLDTAFIGLGNLESNLEDIQEKIDQL